MLGWRQLFHCEINPFGKKVLDYWYPNAESYDDITRTDFTKWRGRVDVFTGGFPCQPFSYAGRRRGAEDDRYLWPSMYRAIDEIQPTWVVAENVAGILTMVEQGEVSKVASPASLFAEINDVRGQYQLRETFTLQRICTDLEGHGYAVQPILIPACAVGAPHRRDRVFIVARRLKDTDVSGRPIRRGGEGCEEHGDGRTAEHASSGRTEMQNDTPRTKENERGGIGGSDGSISDAVRHQHAADTIDEGLQGWHDCDTQGHGQDSDRCFRQLCEVYGGKWPSSDTDNERQPGWCKENWGEWPDFTEEQRRKLLRKLKGYGGGCCGSRWNQFPTQSAVHRGNDGIPFPVDGLTLPWVKWNPRDADRKRGNFSKWRAEALKAYGNAIVPQVMYEIFRSIELTQLTTPNRFL